jgi:hypothetical protein
VTESGIDKHENSGSNPLSLLKNLEGSDDFFFYIFFANFKLSLFSSTFSQVIKTPANFSAPHQMVQTEKIIKCKNTRVNNEKHM